MFSFATQGESYYCRKCRRYWVVGKTKFNKKGIIRKVCPNCRVKKEK